MRKFVLLTVLGAVGLVTFDAESSACGRRRQRRCSCCCVTVCAPAQIAARPTMPIVSRIPFTAPNGRQLSILRTNYQDHHEEAQISTAVEPFTTGSEDNFKGKDRKAAKTSIFSGTPQSFSSTNDVLASLPSDGEMLDLQIPKTPDSDRVSQEQHNVTVPAFIYAASKEADNDFHVILGGADARDTGNFMNAEVSGLPTGSFRQPLSVPRQTFKDHFGTNLPGRGYDLYDPPIPVTVTGSLFFDVDHAAGVVGPEGFRPQTAWEIHPISSISFAQ
jgi:hypothetical protein